MAIFDIWLAEAIQLIEMKSWLLDYVGEFSKQPTFGYNRIILGNCQVHFSLLVFIIFFLDVAIVRTAHATNVHANLG